MTAMLCAKSKTIHRGPIVTNFSEILHFFLSRNKEPNFLQRPDHILEGILMVIMRLPEMFMVVAMEYNGLETHL